MAHRATGTFEVKVTPQPLADEQAEATLGRWSLSKQFHGDLDGTSAGEMLAAGSPATGAGGYVAIERVTGTLGGRTGAFALQHIGTMRQGQTEMRVSVVPDSGTEGLTGLDGTMEIIIDGGAHKYVFTYTLPGQN